MLQDVMIEVANFLLGTNPSPAPVGTIFFEKPDPIPALATCNAINNANIKEPSMRFCCALGYFTSGDIIKVKGSPPSLKPHVYNDGNLSADDSGYIYSGYGGILDLAHIRDNADMTRYIVSKVVQHYKDGEEIDLRYDGSARRLTIFAQGTDPDPYKAALLGAYINFQLAIWHELSTFDDHSCFSAEDNYSNLLGTYIGYKACLDTRIRYNESVTKYIFELLALLNCQETEITRAVLDFIGGVWYNYVDKSSLPKHHLQIGEVEVPYLRRVSPWLVTDVKSKALPSSLDSLNFSDSGIYQTHIFLPTDEDGSLFEKYFKLEIMNPDISTIKGDQKIDIKSLLDKTETILDSKKFIEVVKLFENHYVRTKGSDSIKPD